MTTAREVGALQDGPLDTAIYHCQKAAEKAVKGFLAFHDHRLERSHDVELLVELAAVYEASFKEYEGCRCLDAVRDGLPLSGRICDT